MPGATPFGDKVIFFGASYHADYATVLAAPPDLGRVATAIAEYLSGPPDSAHGTQPWDAIDLRRLRSGDPALPALQAALEAMRDWTVTREQEDVCPIVSVAGPDWDEYLATLDKSDRHEIRRKLRRAAVIGDLSVEICAPTPEAIDDFIKLHNARFGDTGLFPPNESGERTRTFVHRLAELESAESDGGQLHVGLVRCGSRLIYAVVAFDDGSTCYLYNAGMDPAAAELSPGITGTATYLRNRMAAGRRRFDFLRGAEPYKYEWGARDEPIERILAVRGAA
jgi:CelD/BcsL family acetyltransferase involved in cellulose biosynthesis